ncbi:MAG: Rne/Rng family ribonuclease [Caenibius sp.]
MKTRMLIDARHAEETRVAVLKGNRIEEFDFESADRKQIKGNIYLAKVTRVEPSLQAAFVDFGGNRHGFLAFSEIHPDYYQIPKEDREALLAEEAAHAEEEAALRAAEEADHDYGESALDRIEEHDHSEDMGGGLTEVDSDEADEVATIEGGHVENGFDEDDEDSDDASDEDENDNADSDRQQRGDRRGRGRRRQGRGQSKQADELRAKRIALRRRYKIQDVIQRRQVLLVQVVKEERGNKGAALTTYLSLAGRYCVLMPNSSHGGGISRKISSASDRKRLKQIIADLNLPRSMGCIIRTAGLQRTKTEIKRDFDYLARLWDEIRENTLSSTAPALIHSDSDLIKRAIRDIYNREIEEVVVEGAEGHKAAKEFMKLLMPSHARRVKPYSDPVPLFQRYGAEDQLSAMYDPVVQLKSGGYLVINPTEALVSIDINSGRSTKEHGIEQTALSTNLEAAREIARQLRLRDMAGLVVIDFIDMEYNSNVRKVERAMKEALKNDRARIQVGRISGFGLMEMSRQRLRTGVLESTTRECPHCDGTGLVRTAPSAGLAALRLIEEEAARGRGSLISLYASTEAAIYLLNTKRTDLAEIEDRYNVSVEVIPEGENEGAKMRVASAGPRPTGVPKFEPIEDTNDDDLDDLDENEDEFLDEDGADENEAAPKKRRRRGGRRRGGRNRRRDGEEEQNADETDVAEEAADDAAESASDESEAAEEEKPRKRRRRGGRGRRNGRVDADGADDTNGESSDDNAEPAETSESVSVAETIVEAEPDTADQPAGKANDAATADTSEPEAKAAPAKPKRTRRKKAEAPKVEADSDAAAEPEATPEEKPAKPKRTRRKKAETPAAVESGEVVATEEAPAKPKRTRRKKAETKTEVETVVPDQVENAAPTPIAANDAPQQSATGEEVVNADNDASEEKQPARRGWWQRTFGE